MRRPLALLALAAILALTAGCGGGDSATTTSVTTPVDDSAILSAEVKATFLRDPYFARNLREISCLPRSETPNDPNDYLCLMEYRLMGRPAPELSELLLVHTDPDTGQWISEPYPGTR